MASSRADVQSRAAAIQERRRELERRRAALKERRQRLELLFAEWELASRGIQAKKSQTSREEFLKDPRRHSSALGAFHALQELSVVSSALQQERRHRCLELAGYLGLKWLQSECVGDHTVTLGQVQNFTVSGVLQDEAYQDLMAGAAFLVSLVAGLSAVLDVTLPFPCSGGRGFDAVSADAGLQLQRVAHSASCPSSTPQWLLPCALQPFTGRWYHFSVYDSICTSEFSLALHLIDEDLRCICDQQGETLPRDSASTLQILGQLLASSKLGSNAVPQLVPPTQKEVPASPKGGHTGTSAQNRSPGRPLMDFGGAAPAQDGEWTLLDPTTACV